jgi:hypothetical protein
MTRVLHAARAAALALLLAIGTAAQAVCLPQSPWAPIELTGGKLMQGVVPPIKGEWHALWCPTGVFAGGSGEVWKLYTHAVLDKYRTLTATAVWEAAKSVLEAPDPLGALDAMLAAGKFVPPAGTQDRYDWEALLFAACQQGAAVGHGATPAPVQMEKPCAPPTPLPTTQVEVWRVTASGSTLFTVANGKLLAPISGRRAAGGATCDNTKPLIKSGTSNYYPLVGGAANEYAACQRVN